MSVMTAQLAIEVENQWKAVFGTDDEAPRIEIGRDKWEQVVFHALKRYLVHAVLEGFGGIRASNDELLWHVYAFDPDASAAHARAATVRVMRSHWKKSAKPPGRVFSPKAGELGFSIEVIDTGDVTIRVENETGPIAPEEARLPGIEKLVPRVIPAEAQERARALLTEWCARGRKEPGYAQALSALSMDELLAHTAGVSAARQAGATFDISDLLARTSQVASDEVTDVDGAEISKTFGGWVRAQWRKLSPEKRSEAQALLKEAKREGPTSWRWGALVSLLLAAGCAIGKYYVEKADYRHMFRESAMGANSTCIDGLDTPRVYVNFETNIAPPMEIYRDQKLLGEIRTARKSGIGFRYEYSYVDDAVTATHHYTYSFAKRMWLTGESIVSTAVGVTTTGCSPGSQPTSEGLSASPPSSIVGEPVTFHMAAANSIQTGLKYWWSFGSEERWGSASERHTFTTSGLHVVIASAKSPSGQQVSESIFYGVSENRPHNRPPSLVGLFHGDTTVKAGSLVTVAALAYDPDGDALQYVWELDGQFLSDDLRQRARDFAIPPGQHTVSVAVYDSNLGKARPASVEFVGAADGPNPLPLDLRYSPSSLKVEPGQVVTFSTYDLPSSHAAVRWDWDFGDGSPLLTNGTTPVTHVYAREGIYQPSVRASQGDRAVVVNTTVTVGNPTIEQGRAETWGLVSPSQGTTGTTFTFSAHPPGPSACHDTRPAYQFTIHSAGRESLLQSPWVSEGTFATKFATPGVWEAEYLMRCGSGELLGPFPINQPAVVQ